MNISKFQNDILSSRYNYYKAEISSEDPSLIDNEIFLFHGTYTGNLDSIFSNNFDERLSKAGIYGAGIYFTDRFQTAAKYSSCQNHRIRDCKGQGLICIIQNDFQKI